LKLIKINLLPIAIFAFAMMKSNIALAADMADTMRSDGKIWVVVAVVLVILIGLFIYLFSIDKKISTAENNFDQTKK
jgi:hypothetical protein